MCSIQNIVGFGFQMLPCNRIIKSDKAFSAFSIEGAYKCQA